LNILSRPLIFTGSSAWSGRRRPQLPKEELARRVSTNQFAHLAETKQQLAERQIQLQDKEYEIKQQHQNTINALEVKIKEAELQRVLLDVAIREEQLKKLREN
jgi:hypothetical protein